MAFWRLASDFKTNWHIAKRRVGNNYQLAMLDGESAVAGNWDFLIGGIEADKSYTGDIVLTLLAMTTSVIAENERKWLDDELGWGFEDLPSDGRLSISAPVTFQTKANRNR